MKEIAKELIKTAKLLLSKDDSMGAWGGVEYFWPEPRGWEIVDWDKTDRFGSSQVVAYQHYDTGEVVTLDGTAYVNSEGSKAGSYMLEAFGNKLSGKWSSVDDIPHVLSNISKKLLSLKAQWVKYLPKISGWELEDFDTGMTTYIKEDVRPDELMQVTFEPHGAGDMPKVVFKDESADASIYYSAESDYAGRHGTQEKVIKIRGRDGMKKALSVANSLYRKWSKEWYE